MDLERKQIQQVIEEGKAVLGIELGSTRIKAVLINEDGRPIASGSHDWENRYEDGVWTYHLEDIWEGLRDSYKKLKEDVKAQYQVSIHTLSAIGLSAMMHGYMAFDEAGQLLVPFRTWRNTMTEQASEALTELFFLSYPTALEYRSSVSGDLKQRRACKKHSLYDNTCRISPLAADRGEDCWSGRSIRNVSN